MFGWLMSRTVCNILGGAYPTYASYKAVLSSSPEEHKQWLTYWLCYTLFSIAETLLDSIVSWLPLYWEAKIACIVYLSVFGGATTLYNSFVRYFLEKYEQAIDSQVEAISSSVATHGGRLAGQAASIAASQSGVLASQGLQWLAAANSVAAASQQQRR